MRTPTIIDHAYSQFGAFSIAITCAMQLDGSEYRQYIEAVIFGTFRIGESEPDWYQWALLRRDF